MIGSMLVDETEQKTNIRFKNFDGFENYFNASDVDYHSEDFIYTGWLYNLNTTELIKVNRSQDGRGTHLKQDIVDYIGNNCYILKSGNCFITFNNFVTSKDHLDELLTFAGEKQKNQT